jgi:RNA polymerase sigma factor (sigma-70 family)
VHQLSARRERELVAAAAAGDRAACELLVEALSPAMAAVAALYRGTPTVQRHELMQAGAAGLLQALRRYEPGLGVPFWAYASWWVRQSMQQLVSEVTGAAVLSDRAQRALARLRTARADHVRTQGGEPSAEQLAAATELPLEQVASLLGAERTPRTIDALAVEGGAGATIGEALSDPRAEDAYEHVIERSFVEDVRAATASLGERERGILYDHYGFGRPAKTLREIGESLGVSAERVRQIEEQTLLKLRARVAHGEALDP